MTFLRLLHPIIILIMLPPLWHVPAAGSNPSDSGSFGVRPLVDLQGQSPYAVVPDGVRPLFTADEQEAFLQDVDEVPPLWEALRSSDVLEQSERLFQFNRQRDENRITRETVPTTPLAFLWSGMLRHYQPEFQGYSLALGPEITSTAWGLVRFKPMNIPDYMIVRIPRPLEERFRNTRTTEDQAQIGILFIGHLVEEESLIYDISHDGNHEGMILPVVFITDVQYFFH